MGFGLTPPSHFVIQYLDRCSGGFATIYKAMLKGRQNMRSDCVMKRLNLARKRSPRRFGVTCAMLLAASGATVADAGEIGHYVPGVMNIRDMAVPGPGFYGALYNYRYTTDQLND